MDYRYFYLIWSTSFLLIWLVLFLKRKDLQKEMLFISFIFGLGGVLSEKLHIQDWWRPETITGTSIGIEDFIIGFSIAGIAAVLYEVFYRYKLRGKARAVGTKNGDLFLVGFAALFLGLFYFMKLSSFYSAIFAYLVAILCIVFVRKDLIKDSIASGILLLILGIGVYYCLFLIYPNYIEKFWYLQNNWYSALIFGIPVGEYIWYFLTGAFIGPLYEFIRDKRLFAYK